MELSQTALFQISQWTAQLNEVVPYHGAMIDQLELRMREEATSALDHSKYLAHQTVEDPFDLPSEGWRVLERSMNEALRLLSRRHFQRWREGEFHLRRWAIRLGALSAAQKAILARDSLHNHLPALFSVIYYLSVPKEFEEKPEGGTLFLNPIGNLMDFTAPRTNTILPKEGRLVIFPSFVDHSPVPIHWTANDRSRIVISADVFFVSGTARQQASSRVMKI